MRQKTITSLTLQTDARPVELEIPTEEYAEDKPLYDEINEFTQRKLGVNLKVLAKQDNVGQLREVVLEEGGIDVSEVPKTAARQIVDLQDN